LRVKAPPGVSLEPDGSSILLEPGATREFSVSMASADPGTFTTFLSVESSFDTPQELKLLASFAEDPISPSIQKTNSITEQPKPRAEILECYLYYRDKNSFIIVWRNPPEVAPNYWLERRELRRTDGSPRRVEEAWKKWERARVTSKDGFSYAQVNKLRAGTHWTVKVCGNDGERIFESSPLRISLPPEPPLVIAWWVYAAGALVLALAIKFFKKRVRIRLNADEPDATKKPLLDSQKMPKKNLPN
jgi:hypothetical protein